MKIKKVKNNQEKYPHEEQASCYLTPQESPGQGIDSVEPSTHDKGKNQGGHRRIMSDFKIRIFLQIALGPFVFILIVMFLEFIGHLGASRVSVEGFCDCVEQVSSDNDE